MATESQEQASNVLLCEHIQIMLTPILLSF